MGRSSWSLVPVLFSACTFAALGQGTTGGESAGGAGTTGSATTGSSMSGAKTAGANTAGGEGTSGGKGSTSGPPAASSGDNALDGSTGGATTEGSGSTGGPTASPTNCADVLAADPSASDGVYTIDVDGDGAGLDPFDVYCDMTTEGGGWTLVFAYGFTAYDAFMTGENAVSVRPNWPLMAATQSVPISTTPPLSPDDEGAVDYTLWPQLGHSFIVRSNINNGIMCDENTGSLVAGTVGAVDCTLIEDVTGTCNDVVPDQLGQLPHGPGLMAENMYYHWDGDTSEYWPTHDPCGMNEGSQLMGISDPSGAIFLRP